MADILTPEELEVMERRLDGISPAPWKSYVEGRDHSSGSNVIITGEGTDCRNDLEFAGISAADQDFIAACRQDVPKLIAEVKRLRNLLK